MKRKLLPLLCLLFTVMSLQAQVIGTTVYNLENNIILSGNTEATIVVDDANALTFDQGTGSIMGQNGGHGATLTTGNTISMTVTDNANITFALCQYTEGTTAEFSISDASANDLGTLRAESRTTGIDEEEVVYAYEGTSQVITFTVNAPGTVYLHAITIENIESLPSLEGKTQVWDFGAEDFSADASIVQMLDVATMNAWYDGTIVEGSTGNNLPDFTVDVLSWTGKPTSDRLRTTNTSVTRYDAKSNGIYTGYVYANGTVTVTDGLATLRYFTIELEEDDEVSVVGMGNNAPGNMTFVYEDDPSVQNEFQEVAQGTATEVNFIAKEAGKYRIFDAVDKLSVFRISRKNAEFVTITGSMDETAATSIPEGYGIIFTNNVTGKEFSTVVSSQSYSIDLPAGHTYDVSLSDANGYIITSDNSVEVTAAATFDITVIQITFSSLSGTVSGLGSDLVNLVLSITPDDPSVAYIPEIVLDNESGDFSVQLEPDVDYTLTAEGVNDYSLNSSAVNISTDVTEYDMAFTAKSTYQITLTTLNRSTSAALTTEQLAATSWTFTNLNEEGYEYTYGAADDILLRDGTYKVTASGLHAYAIQLAPNSNLVVAEGAESKEMLFEEVTEWVFNDENISSVTAYKGLTFTGSANVRGSNGDLNLGTGATIAIPVKVGDKVIITDYYASNYSIEGGEIVTNTSGKTDVRVISEYVYEGTVDGTVTLTTGGTTYLLSIKVVEAVAYSPVITVGADKDYQTINEALDAISKMTRTSDQVVTVEIDPGNYEEMLVIEQDNVTFTNASSTPSIALANKGVDIDANAVRITSYYGHGYSYYSMDNDTKWNADVLRVNKENEYESYTNAGGKTDGSYWNATVVIYADNFVAENIIFENSFNQYISTKESEDILVEIPGASKGLRPTSVGSTAVQDKELIERAAAIAFAGGDKTILNNCRVVGHQDSFYGDAGSRVAVYKGVMMGGTDYIFGAMTAIFYKSDLAIINSDDADGNDVSFITAAKQTSGRGYLFYECTITSAEPLLDMDNTQRSKPGYLGRPWAPATSEAVFYNTTIETTNASGHDGESLIQPLGWLSTLSGESPYMYEYGTVEETGVDNSASRASWATVLSVAELSDGTAITTLNFTDNGDGWDPYPALIAADPNTDVVKKEASSGIVVKSYQNEIVVKGIESDSVIRVFNLQGKLVKTIEVRAETQFTMPAGCWIINVTNQVGSTSVKVVTL